MENFSKLKANYKIVNRFWITTSNGNAFLGKGRATLLQKIDKFGSLRKAAISLKMSYRKAYYAIDDLNKSCDEPVVILKRGGSKGGSSVVTPYGLSLLKRYLAIQKKIDNFIAKQNF